MRSDYHGSKILIVVPHPGSLSTESTALWCSKMIATSDIPIPAPPSFLALDLSAYKGYFDYSGIDFSKLNLISETTAVEQKNNESYEVLQFLQENEYVYAVHEK